MSMKMMRNVAVGMCVLALSGCPAPTDALPDTEPTSFDFNLTGAQEVPSVDTTATGEGTATLDDNQLTLEGSFEGLSSDLREVEGSSAHIHEAPAGENGPIVFNLDVTPGADNRSGTFEGTFDLTDEQVSAFEDGRYYVNVHTETFPGGEIRGQLEP